MLAPDTRPPRSPRAPSTPFYPLHFHPERGSFQLPASQVSRLRHTVQQRWQENRQTGQQGAADPTARAARTTLHAATAQASALEAPPTLCEATPPKESFLALGRRRSQSSTGSASLWAQAASAQHSVRCPCRGGPVASHASLLAPAVEPPSRALPGVSAPLPRPALPPRRCGCRSCGSWVAVCALRLG